MIKVLYFARLRDELSCAEEQFELSGQTQSVAELKQQIAARGEPWQSAMADENLLVAVNQVVSDHTTAIKSGDEIGFFPPVTGG